MTLLDTNILIYASDPGSPFYRWSRQTIAEAIAGEGAAINAVCLAELCVGDAVPGRVAKRLRQWGIIVVDLPAAAAAACADAYRQYRKRRLDESGKETPAMPLPDFFIGAHALVMDCELATGDIARFRTYFPSVRLITPQ